VKADQGATTCGGGAGLLQGRVNFELRAQATGSRARAGTLTTAHATIETPVFMPVGTRGSVRTQTLDQLATLGPQIILANTYHLLIRPGPEAMAAVGGLHRWMGWDKALLTDSGGFQIFSLPGARTMAEEGAAFKSHLDGRRYLLTPESAIAMQRAIGSDIMMVLDQCIPSTSGRAEAAAAMALTHRWAARSRAARGDSPQALFAIVQGACFEDLRRQSAATLTELGGFDGYAIGGLAVGESRAEREDFTELTCGLLPTDQPRYLMGVGTPIDLLEGVHRGVDMFDCILPTALAQQGVVFTSRGRIDLRRGVHRLAEQPLDPACPCEACVRYPRSYLHHLVKCKEPLGWQLLAFHNLRFYLELMREIRAAIHGGTFAAFYAARRDGLAMTDQDNPPVPKPRTRPTVAHARGAFAVHVATQGHASIKHVPSGEVMHSVNAPDAEAEAVYVAQSRLLCAPRPLVVWDVGLGAAHNAMALIRSVEVVPRDVEIVSFELDLDAFRLALAHQREFAHLRHPAPHILATGRPFERAGLRWRLREGDFLATFGDEPPPDVIFYDPFSRKVDGPLWTLAAFTRLYRHLDRATELFTYTASTAVRTAMLLAGWQVAVGVPSGPKEETTIALRPTTGEPLAGHRRLDAAWLARRARSTARFPAEVDPAEHEGLEARLRAHPQFAAPAPSA
jgi:queuine tRNA-ribosyltransferase